MLGGNWYVRRIVRVLPLWAARAAMIACTACGTDLSLGEMFTHDPSSSTGGPDSSLVAGTGGAGGGPDVARVPDVGSPADVGSAPDVGNGLDVVSGGSDADLGAMDVTREADARVDVVDGAHDLADASSDNRADVADVSICRATQAACTRSDECCTGLCIGQVCYEPGICQASGACTIGGSCCSGRCDPVGANFACRASCSADGLPCTRADQCCSLGCLNGVCGATCRSQGVACAVNADCCSNNCDPGTRLCLFVANDHDVCQNAGEACIGTDETVTCCSNSCNAMTRRCNLPATTCHGMGSTCAADAECCKGRCLPNAQNQRVCQIPCAATGSSCAAGAECCSFRCSGAPSRCAAPDTLDGGAICRSTGQSCAANAQCCSRYCAAGFCDLPCQLAGVGCRVGTDCCSGICTGNVCQPFPIP
jgi:hypothetical protein